MTLSPPSCPFCNTDETRVFLRQELVFALWDGFPVSDGHALIVPNRHVATWFDASREEQAAIFGAIETVSEIIRAKWPVDGFNVGINIGEAAGQTVPHLHLHVIPRRTGDMPDPRGGVRHVVPNKGNYLANRPPEATALVAAEPRLTDAVLTTGEANPLFAHLERDIAAARTLDVAVAFVMPTGVERLYPHFEDLMTRGGRLRLLAGDYLDVTDPDALQKLLDLRTLYGAEHCVLRIFESQGRSFHPKAYVLSQSGGSGVAYVGSSNLSESALVDGIEWNYRIASARDADGWRRVSTAFEELFAHPSTSLLDAGWIARYRARR